MQYTYSFEKLEAWQLSKELTLEIYQLTKPFPAEEKYSLISQIRGSAISVASNLAEGSSRTSLKEQARFSEIAFSSLMEVLNQMIIAKDLGMVSEKELGRLRAHIQKTGNKINSLRNSQLRRAK